MDPIAIEQPFELVATDLLVDFIKEFRHFRAILCREERPTPGPSEDSNSGVAVAIP
jgi:hypothetical protein